MSKTRSELTKTDFLSSYDNKEKKFTLNISNPSINLKNYSILLLSTDINKKIITIDKKFKDKNIIQIENISHPFFCLIYDTKKEKTAKNSFHALANGLIQAIDSLNSNHLDIREYTSRKNAYILEIFQKIIRLFSEQKNRDGAVALLRFSFEKEILQVDEIHDFEKEMLRREDILKTLHNKITELEKIRKEAEYLIKSDENDSIKNDITEKVNSLLSELNNYKENQDNFLDPTISIDTDKIEKNFQLIVEKYNDIKNILEDSSKIILEREEFIDNCLTQLEAFEKNKNIHQLIAYTADENGRSTFKEGIEDNKKKLLLRKERLASYTDKDFDIIKNSFAKKVLEKLDNLYREYEESTRALKQKINVLNLFKFPEKLMGETCKKLENEEIYMQYNSLLKEIDTWERIGGNKKQMHNIQEQIRELLPKLENLKEKYEEHEKFRSLCNEINTGLDNITKKFEKHVERLQGKKPINLRDKIINFIFKAITKEKIRLEEQVILALSEIKNCIAYFSSNADKNTDALKKYFGNLDGILQNKSLTKHRSYLFFGRKPVKIDSQNTANEAMAFVDKIKIEFKIQ